jgi:anti-anti-sigma regulatory factor
LTKPAPRIRRPPLILDLAALSSWHSSAVAALLAAQQRINAHPSAQMILANLPRPLLERLHDTRLAGRFTIADTTDSTIRKITPQRDAERRSEGWLTSTSLAGRVEDPAPRRVHGLERCVIRVNPLSRRPD